MTSVLAVDVWVLIGAFVQCALVLRARRFPADGWVPALGLLCVLPLMFLAFMGFAPRKESGVGLGFIGLGLGLLCAGFYVMIRAPARVTSAGLVSLSATFWLALQPPAFAGWWLLVPAAMSVLSVVYAFGPWRASDGARLLLYLWFLSAAAAVALSGLSGDALYALILRGGDSVNAVPLGEAALTGAQAFLLVQFLMGLFLLLGDDTKDRREKFAARVLDGCVSEERLGWRAAVAILTQAAILFYARRAGATAQNDLIGLAALGALAHGAMTGDVAAARTSALAKRRRKAGLPGQAPADNR